MCIAEILICANKYKLNPPVSKAVKQHVEFDVELDVSGKMWKSIHGNLHYNHLNGKLKV